jgi:hypothetical protein
MLGGHLVRLAAFLMQAEPRRESFGVRILDVYAQGGGVDRVVQLAGLIGF